jgi:hypothetical protein
MSSSYEEPKSWPVGAEGESDAAELTVEKLRQEIAAARKRLDDHRSQLKAIGLEKPEASNDPDGPDQDSGASA